MSRYTTKLQNIQEANKKLEQRILNEGNEPESTTSTDAVKPSPEEGKWKDSAIQLNQKASIIRNFFQSNPDEGKKIISDTNEEIGKMKSSLYNAILEKAKNNKPITPADLLNLTGNDESKSDSLRATVQQLLTLKKS